MALGINLARLARSFFVNRNYVPRKILKRIVSDIRTICPIGTTELPEGHAIMFLSLRSAIRPKAAAVKL